MTAASLDVRPPIQAGDILALLEMDPLPLGVLVVDGIFGAGQAVSVGELREAINLGIPVFGATSLGALRAAEGCAAGIVPLGGIAGEYAAGTRTSDADVALLHTRDGQAMTVPLVNIEHLARMLVTLGAERSAASRLVANSRMVHFTRRTHAVVRDLASSTALTGDAARAHLLESPRLWDRKALDALDAMEQFLQLTDRELARVSGGATLADLVPSRLLRERTSE